MRAYNKTTHAVTSYPRLVAELVFGVKLKKTDDVHHKDGNPLNNDPSNLEIIDHSEHDRQHAKKLSDKIMVCPTCKQEFLWTVKQQHSFKGNRKNRRKYGEQTGPYCSRHCAGIANQIIQAQHK